VKFRKKPVVIEAFQFTGDYTDAVAKVIERAPAKWLSESAAGRPAVLDIQTLEGTMTAFPGDWIIRGVKGEFYPCKPDIFAATYEALPPHEQGPAS